MLGQTRERGKVRKRVVAASAVVVMLVAGAVAWSVRPGRGPEPTTTRRPDLELGGETSRVPKGFASPSTSKTRAAEEELVSLINKERSDRGLRQLRLTSSLVLPARDNAQYLADTRGVPWAHRPDWNRYLPPEWVQASENLGRSNESVMKIHNEMMTSITHTVNILRSNFNFVGVGVRFTSDGWIWVSEIFVDGFESLNEATHPVPRSEEALVPGPITIPQRDWYFAEGTTREGFYETLHILNPLSVAASVQIDYVTPAGARQQSFKLPARTRTTVLVNEHVAAGDVSAVLRSSSPVVAERQMRFRFDRYEGETRLLGSQPSKEFYFAEGYTGGTFREYLALFNPGDSELPVSVTYQFGDGSTRSQTVTAKPRTRETLDVNAEVGSGREVSIAVKAAAPFVAERPMYFVYEDAIKGGHTSSGLTAPSKHLVFAEGYTRAGFHEYLTIQNPGQVGAHVDIDYLIEGAAPQRRTVDVAPNSRFTVKVHEDVPGKSLSIDMTSDQPVVAERPMYFTYNGRVRDGHNVVGSPESARYWLFPGGDTTIGTDTYLTVANPQATAVDLTLTFFDDAGATLIRNLSVRAKARQTIVVAEAAGSGRVLGVLLSASEPVVAEQPSYTLGDVNGGSDVTGFPVSA